MNTTAKQNPRTSFDSCYITIQHNIMRAVLPPQQRAYERPSVQLKKITDLGHSRRRIPTVIRLGIKPGTGSGSLRKRRALTWKKSSADVGSGFEYDSGVCCIVSRRARSWRSKCVTLTTDRITKSVHYWTRTETFFLPTFNEVRYGQEQQQWGRNSRQLFFFCLNSLKEGSTMGRSGRRGRQKNKDHDYWLHHRHS